MAILTNELRVARDMVAHITECPDCTKRGGYMLGLVARTNRMSPERLQELMLVVQVMDALEGK